MYSSKLSVRSITINAPCFRSDKRDAALTTDAIASCVVDVLLPDGLIVPARPMRFERTANLWRKYDRDCQ